MPGNLKAGAPPVLPALAIFLLLIVLLSREASVEEGLPTFLSLASKKPVFIELAGEVPKPGVYQFYDDVTPADVIKLTGMGFASAGQKPPDWDLPLVSGVMLHFNRSCQDCSTIDLKWMPAPHRLAMGIPLHPDRMSLEDWVVLPGIGEVLAERIELDRHKNGDYGHVGALTRVHGIGAKRVNSWSVFFSSK